MVELSKLTHRGREISWSALIIIYEKLGLTDVTRQANYRELFRYALEPGLVDEIRKATNGNFVLGNDRFKEEISKTLGRRVIPGKAGRPIKNEKQTWCEYARGLFPPIRSFFSLGL